jgi:hypothetical protein
MSDDRATPLPEQSETPWPGVQDDGRTGLALAAGMGAAVAGGLIWAAIVRFGNLEIGWAAWGVGFLVGGAMGAITSNRGSTLALAAAGIAVAGLLVGKLAITLGSAGAITEELLNDPASLEPTVAWEMFDAEELEPATQETVLATLESGDTLSDAVWEAMLQQAAARIAVMPEDDRRVTARAMAQGYISRLGFVGGVKAQLSPWDLLWFGLAIATAHRMMRGRAEESAASA